MNSTISLAITISGYVSLVVGAVLVLMSKVKTDNLNDLKERVEILEKERQTWAKENIGEIAVKSIMARLQDTNPKEL